MIRDALSLAPLVVGGHAVLALDGNCPLHRIVELKHETESMEKSIASNSPPFLLAQLPATIPTDEKRFKALFDAYSDQVSFKQKFLDQNAFLVYYTKGFDGPGRPSIEADLPTKQPRQFGARNEAWVAWASFMAEVDYQRENPQDVDQEEFLCFSTAFELRSTSS